MVLMLMVTVIRTHYCDNLFTDYKYLLAFLNVKTLNFYMINF